MPKKNMHPILTDTPPQTKQEWEQAVSKYLSRLVQVRPLVQRHAAYLVSGETLFTAGTMAVALLEEASKVFSNLGMSKEAFLSFAASAHDNAMQQIGDAIGRKQLLDAMRDVTKQFPALVVSPGVMKLVKDTEPPKPEPPDLSKMS
jgi:hypothetical protein